MLFNSIEFIIFLIFVVSIVIVIKNRNFQHVFLLFMSYFFFYFSSNYLISLLIFSTLLDFYAGKAIWNTTNKKIKKLLLITSLAGNLGLLGFFKYADFAILQINAFGQLIDIQSEIPILNLALPIGISFYTFQTISYTVDIYRGNLSPSKSLKEFALFVSFFPQLVAGPIVRAKEFLPQLREFTENANSSLKLKLIKIQNNNLKLGTTIMAFGFFKKMFFADNIAPFVDTVFSDPSGLESFSIILATLGYGIQIYSDFSGYSDIAIGAAIILGFKLPINFNKPYFAFSPSDFWRKWHISLSSWLRDYLYIPLGGNKKSSSRTYLNVLVVMLLGGLWHGASWNFILWGFMHALYLAVHKLISNKLSFLTKNKFFKSRIWFIISVIITQYFVFLAWIPFRVRDPGYILYSMEKYVLLDFATDQTIQLISTQKLPIALMGFFIILHYFSYRQKNLSEKISKLNLKTWVLFLISIMVLILFFYDGIPENFIYFRF